LDLSYELRARVAIEAEGFRKAHVLGQNFILDESLISSLLDAAEVGPDDFVLEIGPGAGVMTALLSDRCARVLSVEIDGKLKPVLDAVLEGKENVRLEFADVMRINLPKLTREAFGERPFRVVANLPYYITSDVVEALVATSLPVSDICVMVQKEAAERILSRPGTKKWCALAATIAYFGEPEVLLNVPRAAFEPQPHVDSAFLRICVYAKKPVQAESDDMMKRVIAAAFLMRRKKLANNLKAAFGLSHEDAVQCLNGAEIDPDVRGEALDIPALARLSDVLTGFLAKGRAGR
jgi:16S rRNA (adenine1518-N6/adenine1519-N6)-dimethyltransferase